MTRVLSEAPAIFHRSAGLPRRVPATASPTPRSSTHSPQLISTFLAKHQAPAPDDTAAFNAAVKQAKHDGKVVFVWFSAPW